MSTSDGSRRRGSSLDATVVFDIDATPPGSQWTATARHSAAGQGHCAVVELLVARGAGQTIKDVRYQSTPLGWATHMGRDAVIAVLSELSL